MNKYFLSLALFAASHTAWADSNISIGAGVDYTTGKYGGDTSTNILYLPVTGKYQADKLTLKLTVPYIQVSSTGAVVRGLGTIRTVTTTKTTTQSGLGDVKASAGYNLYDSGILALNLVGNVKFGTASYSKGLGTGENDYSAQVDGYYSFDSTTLFATLGHEIVGQPAGVEVNDINYATLGFSQKLDEKRSAGVMLDVAQSATNLAPGTRELALFFSHRVNKDMKWQTNLMKGFSDASPDYGVGFMMTWLL